MGYGGVSQVIATTTKKSRQGETIHMGEVSCSELKLASYFPRFAFCVKTRVGEQRVSVCKLHNIGCRSAYVKAVCLSGCHWIPQCHTVTNFTLDMSEPLRLDCGLYVVRWLGGSQHYVLLVKNYGARSHFSCLAV